MAPRSVGNRPDFLEVAVLLPAILGAGIVPHLGGIGTGWRSSVVLMSLVAALGGALVAYSRLREARARDGALREARAMLRDRLSGQLHIVLESAAPPDRTLDDRERERLSRVVSAIREVESALELLSRESLAAWQAARERGP